MQILIPKTIVVIRVDEWLSNIISTVVMKNILPSYCISLDRVFARATVEHQYNMKTVPVRHIRYVKMESDLIHVDRKLSV